jgi:hypothetical protein
MTIFLLKIKRFYFNIFFFVCQKNPENFVMLLMNFVIDKNQKMIYTMDTRRKR